jgi:hypothetical protein
MTTGIPSVAGDSKRTISDIRSYKTAASLLQGHWLPKREGTHKVGRILEAARLLFI